MLLPVPPNGTITLLPLSQRVRICPHCREGAITEPGQCYCDDCLQKAEKQNQFPDWD